jgi:ABC-type nitrate/sulfonate/bicarbonate transport system permease component
VILQAQPALETARIFAAILLLSALALALYGLVALSEHLLAPWQAEARDHA